VDEAGRRVPGDADHRQGVGAVGLDGQVVDDVGAAQRLDQRRPRPGPLGQDHDPVAVVAKAQLHRRADHAFRPLAPDLAPGDLQAAWQHRADGGQGHQLAGGHVRCAADDLAGLPVAGVHPGQADPVGTGVGDDLQHTGHDDAVEAVAHPFHGLNHHAEVVEGLPQRHRVEVERSELAQPGQGHPHGRSPYGTGPSPFREIGLRTAR
jgi:hypothetical protein